MQSEGVPLCTLVAGGAAPVLARFASGPGVLEE